MLSFERILKEQKQILKGKYQYLDYLVFLRDEFELQKKDEKERSDLVDKCLGCCYLKNQGYKDRFENDADYIKKYGVKSTIRAEQERLRPQYSIKHEHFTPVQYVHFPHQKKPLSEFI